MNRLNSLVRHVAPDILLTILAYASSLFLIGERSFPLSSSAFWIGVATITIIRVSLFALLQVYSILWRYIALHDAVRLSIAQGLATIAIFAVSYFVTPLGLAQSALIIEAVLFLNAALLIRVLRRSIYELRPLHSNASNLTKILIYGAGTNGRTIVQRYLNGRGESQIPVGFIDDDSAKEGKRILGVRVLGPRTELNRIIRNTGANQLVISINRPSGKLLREVVEQCREFNIKPRLMKGVSDITSGSQGSHLHRDIKLEDLLSRKPKKIDFSAAPQLSEKTILVTGAGGSIGSELCRQIIQVAPRQLILLDHSECSLYNIDRELRVSPSHRSPVIPVLADIKNKGHLKQIFEQYQPEIVFHAAAYKHVHLAQNNPCSTILNNILGTRNLLDLSEDSVDTFILISSDKAVNPTGIMGATKRVCELLVTHSAQKTQRRFASVRFGNVLGSSGSLVPLLTEQISNGGPITVTDKRMKRYFMLIPEAVSLVLKCSGLAKPGDIFVLEMDKPVRIIELAKSVRAWLGKTEEEVPIIVTGLRPGEKIQEELYLTGTEVSTGEPDIMVIPKGDMDSENTELGMPLDSAIEEIINKATLGSRDALVLVDKLVFSNSAGSPIEHKFFEGNFGTSTPAGEASPPPTH